MIVLLIVSILLVALYVGAAIWKERELPDSISSLVYLLPDGKWRWLWTVWIWAATYTLTPALFELMPESLGAVAHAFATSMLFTGAMPLVKRESNRTHNILAISAGVFSQMCVVIICPWWLLLWTLMVILFLLAMKENGLPQWINQKGLFVTEIVCWLALFGALFTHILKQ